MQSNVIEFPVEKTRPPCEETPPTCLDCEHVTAGTRGLYCTYFREWIVSEDVAKECSEFDPL